jgi:ABC-2 type transport system permease protein
LPTSDTATVLSKLVFALLVMPAIAALGVLASQIVIYLLVSVKFSSTAGLLATLWSPSVWAKATGFAVYILLLVELWALPLMAWVLLVSAYAPRSPMLIALLVPLCAALIEKLLLGSTHVLHIVFGRMSLPHASTGPMVTPEKIDWSVTTDFSVLATPELWLGLLVAAGFAAIEIRRRRDPSA